MVTLLAADAEPSQGWGGPVALILTALLFWAATSAHKRWLSTRENPSPTDGQKSLTTVNPQVSGDSDSADSGKAVAVRPTAAVDAFVAEKAGTKPATAVVREAAKRLRISESSAWRAWRRVTKGGAS